MFENGNLIRIIIMSAKRILKKLGAKLIKTKTVTFNELTLTGAFEDYGLLKAIGSGHHETFFEELFIKHLEPEGDVLDVGAHLGKYSLIAAKYAGNNSRVFSFEPHPRTYKFLTENIYQNSLEKRIFPFNTALADSDGDATLNADLLQSDFTSMAVSRNEIDIKRINIRTKTLDSAAPDCLPATIKVDVEGAECLVLEGIRRPIQRARERGIKPNLFIESNSEALQAFNKTPRDLFDKVRSLGFERIQSIAEESKSLKPVKLDNSTGCENWFCQ